MIILLTGESGVGKTSVAKTLMNRHPGILLDGDDMRDGLNSDLGFSDRDIMENMRRTAHIAILLHDQLPDDRRVVYITCIAPLLAGRNLVHELCGPRLWEIRLQYDYRASDDVKGLYKAGTPMRAYEDYPSEALLLSRRINRVYRYYNDTVWALAARIEELWPADKTA